MPQVTHKTSTRERHCCQFVACLVMVSQVSPHAFISFSMVLHQVSLGRPRFRFPFGVQRMAILGSASGGIRHTCPSHLHLLFLRDFAFVLWCSSFEILLGQKILRISKHLFWKVCILWTILVVSFQHSAPYSKTLRTLLLQILSLVLVPTF